jgi:hypothetical protein
MAHKTACGPMERPDQVYIYRDCNRAKNLLYL